MLLPLRLAQVTIWKLFAIKEHFYYPEELVASVEIRFLDLIATFSINALHRSDIITEDHSLKIVSFAFYFFLTFFLFHVFVHHLKDLLATPFFVRLGRVKEQKRTNHTISTAKHFQVVFHRNIDALAAFRSPAWLARTTRYIWIFAQIQLLDDLFQHFVIAFGFKLIKQLP